MISAPSQEEVGSYQSTRVEAGDSVWIKGSRAMALDRIVDVLYAQLREMTTATVYT